jgi:hypothetical protein
MTTFQICLFLIGENHGIITSADEPLMDSSEICTISSGLPLGKSKRCEEKRMIGSDAVGTAMGPLSVIA